MLRVIEKHYLKFAANTCKIREQAVERRSSITRMEL
jgi:hypothetical protein